MAKIKGYFRDLFTFTNKQGKTHCAAVVGAILGEIKSIHLCLLAVGHETDGFWAGHVCLRGHYKIRMSLASWKARLCSTFLNHYSISAAFSFLYQFRVSNQISRNRWILGQTGLSRRSL